MEETSTEKYCLLKRDSKTQQLSSEQRNGVLQLLLQHKVGNKLKHGTINKISTELGVTRVTVSRIWHRAKEQYDKGVISANVSSKVKEKCRGKRKNYSEQLNKIKDIPYNQRNTFRSLSHAIGIPTTTLYRILKEQSAKSMEESANRMKDCANSQEYSANGLEESANGIEESDDDMEEIDNGMKDSDNGMEESATENSCLLKRNNKSQQLTGEQRNGVLQMLLQHKVGNKLKHGTINKISAELGVARGTVSRIWHRAKEQYDKGVISANVLSRVKEKCRGKRKNYSDQLNRIKDIPYNQRSTFRSLSNAIGIPKSTLFRIFKEGKQFKRISSTIRSTLTDENKQARMAYCLSMIKPNGFFHDMNNYIYIDEKCFYLTQEKRSYYIMLDEIEPDQIGKSKQFINKVMFMVAVARPRYDTTMQQYFDGKIGLWPFIIQEPAKRSSKHRLKGALVTKPIQSINAIEYTKMIVDNVLPSIRSKFPESYKGRPIYIQQDYSKLYCSSNNEVIASECSKEGWCLKFTSQPPNSPDLNVLNLGFFNSIQSLQHKTSPKTVDELIECVQGAFNALKGENLDHVFLTLQKSMELTMSVLGDNNYQVQRVNKKKILKRGN